VNDARRALGASSAGLYRFGARVWGKTFSLLVGGAFAEFGPASVIQPPVRLQLERRIAIGRGVYVGPGAWLQVIDGFGHGTAIVIGDGTSIAGACVLSSVRSIELGRSVLLARNVYVADHSHAFGDVGRPVVDQGIDRVAPVVIGDGAWIGQNVVVGPGVSIGAGAVIGANSVVLDDVPAHAVAVGAPATVRRSLVPEEAVETG
jgi:lipopolysaccharide O-acetyltransferase